MQTVEGLTDEVKTSIANLPEDPDSWETIIGTETITLMVGDTRIDLPLAPIATHLLALNSKEDWLPIATRYISPDDSVVLVEKDASILTCSNGEKILLPWTYYLFHSNRNVEVMFRPFVLLGSKNTFHSFFLNRTRYNNDDPTKNFDTFETTKDFVDSYVSSIKAYWESTSDVFDIEGLDQWLTDIVKKFPAIIGDGPGVGEQGWDRVETMKRVFGLYAHEVTMPSVNDELRALFTLVDGEDLMFRDIAKIMNDHAVSQKTVYTQLVEAFKVTAGV